MKSKAAPSSADEDEAPANAQKLAALDMLQQVIPDLLVEIGVNCVNGCAGLVRAC
jgi:hypothetical protein